MSNSSFTKLRSDGKPTYINCKKCGCKIKSDAEIGFYGYFVCGKCNYINRIVFIVNDDTKLIGIQIKNAKRLKKSEIEILKSNYLNEPRIIINLNKLKRRIKNTKPLNSTKKALTSR